MIRLRRVVGDSMLPALRPGQIMLFVQKRRYVHGDVVLSAIEGRDVVKRLRINNTSWSLRGDNTNHSTNFDNISSENILGKLIFPQA